MDSRLNTLYCDRCFARYCFLRFEENREIVMPIWASRASFWIPLLIFGISFAFPSGGLSQEMPRMSRAQFYATTPFGALAWIPSVGTTSRDDASGRKFVRDMSTGSCFSLPVQNFYWFLLNHKD